MNLVKKLEKIWENQNYPFLIQDNRQLNFSDILEYDHYNISKIKSGDVVALIGKPHLTSITYPNKWVYFQRTITKGKLHKLGQNVLKENNVLELNFDKYGVLKDKKFYKKEDMNKVEFSKAETKNEISRQSFVGKFLSSVKQKMYGKKKF